MLPQTFKCLKVIYRIYLNRLQSIYSLFRFLAVILFKKSVYSRGWSYRVRTVYLVILAMNLPLCRSRMAAKLDRHRNLTLKSRTSRVEPLGRSSLRSKGSSNSSSQQDKVKLVKNCLRKFVEFIFAQIGVGGIMVCYTIVGASIFQVTMKYSY